ncbi:uncharacterized protein EV420DRAFT_1521988 [Desarmillaria tabescens]|uniref:Secreted protein n=1 Tax=Armillaria tabescens TaxID=1929756 RepID=A0AA39TQH3_ARMTA|nr:uncharacterized protein EV420DRAFT_1521988 [Desarmillaria tabescens]KAK0462973.1 hypothetical protein EV420DRAFT_1521988 [Desarmillaria tabescens]
MLPPVLIRRWYHSRTAIVLPVPMSVLLLITELSASPICSQSLHICGSHSTCDIILVVPYDIAFACPCISFKSVRRSWLATEDITAA